MCLLCSVLPVQLMLLGGHIESPVLRVCWFWQEMLAGRFELIGVQVRNSSLNLLVPQVSLQYGVLVQLPKMNGAGKKGLNLFFHVGSKLTCALLVGVTLLHISQNVRTRVKIIPAMSI